MFLLLRGVGDVGQSAEQTRNCDGFFEHSQICVLLQLKARQLYASILYCNAGACMAR